MDVGKDNLGPHADRLYSALTEAHHGLSDLESHQLNARIILILANLVGEIETLEIALITARQSMAGVFREGDAMPGSQAEASIPRSSTIIERG